MNRLVLVLALAGCDQVFNLTRPPDARVEQDTMVDGIDAPPGVCDLGAAGPANPIPVKGLAIAAGNFDDDSKPDIVVGSSTSSSLQFRFNDNGFSTASDVNVGLPVLDLAVGRIDGDDLDDVAFITAANANAMLQTATSWDRRMVSTIDPPRSIAIADFDTIGLADLLVTIPTQQIVQIYFGDTMTYSPSNGSIPTTGAEVVSAFAIDVEIDGDQDIVAAVENQNAIVVYRDDGPGFVPDPPITTGTKPNRVGAALLGDRVVRDLLSVNNDSRTVGILRNDGNGTFTASTLLDVGEAPRGLVIADINKDLYADILLVSNKGNRLSWIPGTATGFELRRDYTTVAKPTALAVADFTGDGTLDVAVLGEDDGFVIHPTACVTP